MCITSYTWLAVSWLSFSTAQDVPCNTFRDCDESARAARNDGDLQTARTYFSKACFLEVPDHLLALRDSACRQVTTLSRELEDYEPAYDLFDDTCRAGSDAGCFYLALLEEDRGNLDRALLLMEPLCEEQYIIHENMASTGCSVYERLRMRTEVRNTPQPRANAVQVPVLGGFLVLSLVAAVVSVLGRHRVSLILCLSAFAAYAYYESGVSPYAAIRIDLLIILPILFVNLLIIIRGVWSLIRNKPVPS